MNKIEQWGVIQSRDINIYLGIKQQIELYLKANIVSSATGSRHPRDFLLCSHYL